MKNPLTPVRLFCCLASLIYCIAVSGARADDVFITIGGGDVSGVYFPTGLAIAKIVNNKRDQYGIRATVEATAGATFNINAIMAGYLEFGLTQSDKQFQAVNGLAEWEQKGPQKKLRSIFSLHDEAVTLLAAQDANINSIMDLRGKRVSTGNPGSNQQRTIIDALGAFGIDPDKDILRRRVFASDAPALLQDRGIDAYFFTVGHPSQTILRGLSGQRKTRIVPITGPAIDKLVAQNVYYVHSTIPVKQLYPEVGDQPEVDTFGVIATLCTSSDIPEDLVYALTKEIFENFDMFRRQHPAFNNLKKEGMLEGLSAPLHMGAVRYYREAGFFKDMKAHLFP